MKSFIFSFLICCPLLLFAQTELEFTGIVSDKKTGTPLENAIVIAQPTRINKAGYYSGVTTKKNGNFKVRTTFDLPLFLYVTKKGCKSQKIKIKADSSYFEVVLKCDGKTIENIIAQRNADDDGDGILNFEDDCPDQAGEAENKGCPWPDSDGDTVIDKEDDCPKTAGDHQNKGCPWPDQDGDGVVDREDGCPDEVGTPSNKGCPEIPQALVAFTQEERSTLYFAFDSAGIDDTNNALIQQVVALLKQYRASQIRIIGHASSEGSSSYNQKLSEQRANAVRQAIVAAGVDADRVEAVGAGEDQPIANNTSKSGRAKNRRVVFEVQ